MKKLTNKELKMVRAAGAGGWIVAGIIAGISFLAGFFDGFSRPYKCR